MLIEYHNRARDLYSAIIAHSQELLAVLPARILQLAAKHTGNFRWQNQEFAS